MNATSKPWSGCRSSLKNHLYSVSYLIHASGGDFGTGFAPDPG
jgi:hypothetical protein